MVNRRFLLGLKDLFQALPTFSRSEWMEWDNLDPAKPTVVLVSGFGATYRSLTVIRKRLIKDGFNVFILALDWHQVGDSFKGFYRLAEKLSTFVLTLKKKQGMRRAKVYLVAHSAGGLACRYYVQQLGGWHYTNGLVTLATPHRGTWYAALGFLTHMILKGRCLFQLLPFSPFVRKLNQVLFPEGYPLVSFSSHDDILCPKNCTKLPDSIKGIESVHAQELKRFSHGEFLTSKIIYSKTLQALRNMGALPTETKKSA